MRTISMSKWLGTGLRASCIALALQFGPAQALAADPAPGGLSGLLGDLWAKLRAASPRSSSSVQATAAATMTAGIRGAEATESELKPYWKGDPDQDPAVRAERQALQSAQEMADAGKFAEAAKTFDAFLQTYPNSSLVPNAAFGSALAYAAAGDKARASAAFESFIKQNAQNPLARDAEQALAALK